MPKILHILLLFLFIGFTGLCAQSNLDKLLHTDNPLSRYSAEKWTAEDGLPQNSITAIVQTDDDYLWLSTYAGIVRFDGEKFTVFDNSNLPVLKSNRILTLFKDSRGRLWIGTQAGQIIIYENNEFRDITPLSLKSIPAVSHFSEAPNGDIWVIAEKSILKYDGFQFKKYTTIEYFDDSLPVVVKSTNTNNYVGTTSGLYLFDQEESVPLKGFDKFEIHDLVLSEDTLWVCADGNLYIVPNQGELTRIGKSSTNLRDVKVNTIYEDSRGYLWIGTEKNGLLLYDKKKIHKYDFPELKDTYILSILEDHEGNIWLGTGTVGLVKLKYRSILMIDKKNGLAGSNIYPVAGSPWGSIYIGTPCEGFSEIRNGSIINYTHNQYPGLHNDCVWSLLPESENRIWIGTYSGGLFLYDNGNFQRFYSGNGFIDNNIFSIFKDSRGNIWVGTLKGLAMYKNGRFRYFGEEDGLAGENIRYMHEDKKGRLWIVSSKGITLFENGIFRKIYESQDEKFFRVVYEDQKGNFWFGTYGNGLFYYDETEFFNITVNDGLYDNIVSAIIEDDYGFFWMTCNRGIFKISSEDLYNFIEGKTEKIISYNYGLSEGLNSIEFNGGMQPSSWKTEEGKLLFPTVNGVAVIGPSDIFVNSQKPEVYIEKVVVDGEVYNYPEEVNIPPDYESIEIFYTALSYYSVDNVLFKYQLEGLDEEFREAITARKASFRHLPPGKLTFKVIASNNDGLWNTTGDEVVLNIKAHFYETTQFYIFSGVLILLTGWLVAHLRIMSLKRNERRLENIVEERTLNLNLEKQRAEELLVKSELAKKEAETQKNIAEEANEQKSELLRIVTHNLKNPLGSIIGASEIIISDSEDQKTVKELAGIIRDSSYSMLESIKKLLELEEPGTEMEKEPADPMQIVKDCVNNNTLAATLKGQVLTLETIDESLTVMVNKERLNDAIDNLINNAIKYSRKGEKIIVSVKRNERGVRIEVQDNGPGLSPDDLQKVFKKYQKLSAKPTGNESSSGLGLSLVKKIAELHNGTAGVETEYGKGSTFYIEIPLV